MADDLQTAIGLHRAGRLAEAAAIYQGILAGDPRHAEALQLLGLVACQQNDLPRAADLIRQAVELAPGNAEFQVNLAEVCRRMNRMGEAEAALRRAVELAPGNAFAWYNLGVVLRRLKPAEAARAFARALEIEPRLAEAHNNLGLLRHQAGDFGAAIELFRQALALRPGHAETENNLGLSLWKAGREHEAIGSFKTAIRARPEFVAAHLNLGTALRKLGRRAEGLASLKHAASLDAGAPEIQRELGRALLETGRVEEGIDACRRAADLSPEQGENWHALATALSVKAAREASADSAARADAIAAYERALELQPEMAEWGFELAAARGKTPEHPPDTFVRSLFEEYAPRFENHLVKELHYRVPEELLAAVLALRPEPREKWEVLDLGCGTGRVGELFRSHAARITGVDLAPAMVRLARQRGGGKVYDEVLCVSALEALGRFENRFDVIAAADVLIYVGGLEDLFAGAARALKPQGLLAFSLERHDGEGFVLHRQKRYAHSLAYARAMGERAGLREAAAAECGLRDDVPPGWIVVLQKG
jgi:predicted TPR repeat methyltransferase